MTDQLSQWIVNVPLVGNSLHLFSRNSESLIKSVTDFDCQYSLQITLEFIISQSDSEMRAFPRCLCAQIIHWKWALANYFQFPCDWTVAEDGKHILIGSHDIPLLWGSFQTSSREWQKSRGSDFAFLTEQSRSFRWFRISPVMRWWCEHSNYDFEYAQEHLRSFRSSGMRVLRLNKKANQALKVRQQSEEFHFHIERLAHLPKA
jgi:hypothetical protein